MNPLQALALIYSVGAAGLLLIPPKSDAGTLSGRVTYMFSEAPVSNAVVTLVNESTGETFKTETASRSTAVKELSWGQIKRRDFLSLRKPVSLEEGVYSITLPDGVYTVAITDQEIPLVKPTANDLFALAYNPEKNLFVPRAFRLRVNGNTVCDETLLPKEFDLEYAWTILSGKVVRYDYDNITFYVDVGPARNKSTPDGFCPENYGDWSSCPLNEVGNRCNVCDPDCGACGSIRFSQFKENASQNEQLTVKVEYNVPVVKAVTLWRVISGTDYYISTANCQVQGNVCTATFSPSNVFPAVIPYLTTPSQPGSPYTFKSYLSVSPDIIITKTGYTLPRIEIQNPSPDSTLSGLTNIQVKAQSDSSISKIKWYIEKKSSGANQPLSYSPVNIINNQGSCTFCNAVECNLLGSTFYSPNPPSTNVVSAKDFDTLKCDNNDFMIKVAAEDLRGNKAETSIPVKTSNQNAPCTDNCPTYDSTILKIVIAKVKTWI